MVRLALSTSLTENRSSMIEVGGGAAPEERRQEGHLPDEEDDAPVPLELFFRSGVQNLQTLTTEPKRL
jgi:hypothetical protein